MRNSLRPSPSWPTRHSEVAQDLKSGTGQPNPGYVGKDYFEVEVSYERSGTRLKSTLQADVTITD